MTKKEKQVIDDFMQSYLDSTESLEITGFDDGYAPNHILDRMDTIMAFLEQSGNSELYKQYEPLTEPYFKKYWKND